MSKKPKQSLTVRLDPEVRVRIETLAREDDRSLGSWISAVVNRMWSDRTPPTSKP